MCQNKTLMNHKALKKSDDKASAVKLPNSLFLDCICKFQFVMFIDIIIT